MQDHDHDQLLAPFCLPEHQDLLTTTTTAARQLFIVSSPSQQGIAIFMMTLISNVLLPLVFVPFVAVDANNISENEQQTNLFGRSGPQIKGDVSFSLSTSKDSLASDEDVLINVTVKNNTPNKRARVLNWIVPCDFNNLTSSSINPPKDMSSFEVNTLGGHTAKYLGALIKRGEPSYKDFLTLEPGAEISCTIDLGKYFEFVSPSEDDVYEIKFTATASQLSAPSARLETLNSGTLSIQIAARDVPTRALRERKLQAINNFHNCDVSQQNVIADARSRAAAESTNALNVIDDVGRWRNAAYCPRYKEWFGDYDDNRHTVELRPGYSAVRDRLNHLPIVFDCKCTTTNAYAYIISFESPYRIYLCPLFWAAQMTGTNSKMGTIVHEVSHISITADTRDYAVGQRKCRELSMNNPGLAVNNADSHEYIAENDPSLSCSNQAPSCMSGNTRVQVEADIGDQVDKVPAPYFKIVRDLVVGDTIQGLDKNLIPSTCTVEAVGDFGTGPVFGNYTEDHFILDISREVVFPNGAIGSTEIVDKYAVLTSCPVGVDESGIGFTALASMFLGTAPLAWSDYVLIHEAIVEIVRNVGPFVFSPLSYTSMDKVKKYTTQLYRTMLKCSKNHNDCSAFEIAAKKMVDNSFTKESKKKVKAGFANFGNPYMSGSISAAVTKGKSVRY